MPPFFSGNSTPASCPPRQNSTWTLQETLGLSAAFASRVLSHPSHPAPKRVFTPSSPQ